MASSIWGLMTAHLPPSKRTAVKRGKLRAEYDPRVVRDILAAGLVAHVGVNTPDGPIVLPMAYGVTDDDIFIHGGIANAMMRGSRSVDVCLTITIVDGLVVARTPFDNSMNYRSVVIRGTATVVEGHEEKIEALRVVNDHVAPIWDTAREPTVEDVRITMVLSVPLTEASAKVRTGDPMDGDEDKAGPHWAGVVPITTTWGTPRSSEDLTAGIAIPEAVANLEGTDANA